MSERLEAEIRSIGKDLHDRLQRLRQRGSRLDEGLMDMAAGDPELRAAVMRFVDVYPACRGPRDVAVHLVQHLSVVEDAPAAVRLARALGETPARDALALPAAVAVRRMARRFIVGTSPEDALGFLVGEWERGIAATIDLLGELTVSREEGRRYQQRCIAAIETLAAASAGWPERPRLERDSSGPLPRANLSVKVSALTPKLPPRAPKAGSAEAASALAPILAAGRERGAHVHIDMEHFDLLEATRRALLERLDEHLSDGLSAGIVVQAYLRDCSTGLAPAPARIRSPSGW
jgi:proline dehydrogenase